MSFKAFERLLDRADYWYRVWLYAATEDERLGALRTYEYYMDRAKRAVKEGIRNA